MHLSLNHSFFYSTIWGLFYTEMYIYCEKSVIVLKPSFPSVVRCLLTNQEAKLQEEHRFGHSVLCDSTSYEQMYKCSSKIMTSSSMKAVRALCVYVKFSHSKRTCIEKHAHVYISVLSHTLLILALIEPRVLLGSLTINGLPRLLDHSIFSLSCSSVVVFSPLLSSYWDVV